MSEFMDNEAEVSDKETSSSDSEDELPKKSKAKKSAKSKRQIDSSEEDDDDEEDAEDLKDLINDDVEEEEEPDSDDGGGGAKRKHADDDDDEDNEELDEEDLALLSENLGVSFASKKKKLKRVRRLSDGESDQDEVAEDPKNAIANELFDGDDEPNQRTSRREDDELAGDRYGDDSESGESEDEDDFIVDDRDQPIKKPKKRRGQHRYNDEAMQQAQDIFGVEFDFEDLAECPDFDDDYYEEQEEEGYEDETEGGAEGKSQRKKTKSKKERRSIYDQYEPTELEKSHMTEGDREIREADVPERFLLRPTKVKETQDEPEIEEEAEWIYTQAFNTNTLTSQAPEGGRRPLAGQKEPQVILKIREALKFIRTNFLEVPFIATYRKEYISGLNQSDLWTVYKWDEKYCELQHRKKQMIRLFNNMLSYQIDLLGRNMTLGDQRIISDNDIERLARATTLEELHDCHKYFQLHYAHMLPAMRVEVAKQERLKKREAKQKMKEERELAKLEAAEGGDQSGVEEDLLEDEVSEEEDDEAIEKRFSSITLKASKDPYFICKDAGIGALAAKFGLTAEQLGENIRDNYTKHEVQQFDRTPEDAAQDYICTRFSDTNQVLEAARVMVAREISRNPLVRKCIRSIFYERGLVNVCPKEKAIKHPGLIDENHPCYPHKYLKAKPISSFTGDQFLQLLLAERDDLLKVDIVIDEYSSLELKRKHVDVVYSELYHVDAYSEVANKWNEQRKMALEMAFQKMLYPEVVKEIKGKLESEATCAIIMEAAKKLRESLRVAPYTVTEQSMIEDEEFSVVDGVRILGFAFVPQHDQAAFAVVIDGEGEVIEHLRLPSFMLRKNLGGDSKLKENDVTRLKSLIVSKKPHVIALGADSLQTRFVLKELSEIIEQLSVENDYPSIPIEVIDSELSNVYANSIRGKLEFPDWPVLLRTAVSIARRLQEPLVEFAQLCSSDEEILCLKFHPLQDKVPKDQLLDALNTEFINIVNAVGVDVNQAILHPHRAALVQFIAGFGPRKAGGFLKTLKKLPQQCLESRTQLIMNCKFGAKVFINCAGFVKIDTSQLSDNSETYIEILDSTRVHPEAYEWARKMAVDALEYDEENEVNPSAALEEILQNPEKLKDLDLDAFAEELEKQGFGNKTTTLYDIRTELSSRYKDPREPYAPPSAEKLFTMLTNETPNTLYSGKLVTARVTRIQRKPPTTDELDSANPKRDDATGLWACPFCTKNDFGELSEVWNHFDAGSCPGSPQGVVCTLENGLHGYIKLDKLSNQEVTDPEEKVRVGQTIHARVLGIKVDKFSVDLTCRSNDLNDVNFEFRPEKDTTYYDFNKELEDEAAEEAKKKKTKRQSYVKRIIVHPCFHNIDYKKAESMMSNMSQGDAIIRPSSKGQDHLTLTWKVCKGINQHVDILEKGKDNAFSLGSQLYIGNECFEDLDEIIARYVTPMAGYARDLTSFKYFRNAEGGKPELMEKYLMEERAKQPAKIHYFLSASKQYPGKFILSYFPRNKAVHEYITVTHEGFRFRAKMFHSVNHLFRWFKEHFRDPIPQKTPIRTPAPSTLPGSETPLNSASQFDHNIQRVAAMMPPQIFNTLSQVSGSTPYSSTPNNQRSGFMPPPSGTPSYASQRTPSYTTPSQNSYRSGMPPPSNRGSSGRPDSRSGSGGDWSNIAGSWSQGGRRPPSGRTPRTPNYATPGASSQMSISPTQTPGGGLHAGGDQTPLEDEWA